MEKPLAKYWWSFLGQMLRNIGREPII